MQSPQSNHFKENVVGALKDEILQGALRHAAPRFVAKRGAARDRLPEFDGLRDKARDLKDHVLAHLDLYLEAYEAKVKETGGHVHWAADAAEAREIILRLAKERGAKKITKGKSMISEEINLNEALAQAGIAPIETDLGEYIIQLRNERPSHIIAPAVHLTRSQIEADFRATHTHLDPARSLKEIPEIVGEARQILRQQYLEADIGITGANFLIAETGTSIIVTNEGNGDLTQILPKTHIVIASIEKLVPTLEDAASLLRLLARSATGQEFSTYTTFSTGPKRADDPDGPEEYHVVLLDNGRSDMLGGEFADMLRCIRCGACMNHCPVYNAVGGHAYGWVYPGPMGSVLTPALIGVEQSRELPNASTFCGRCEEVCPMRIPLPKMLRHWREREFERHLTPKAQRFGLKLWAWFAKRPRTYALAQHWGHKALRIWAMGRGRIGYLPLATGWTKHRDFPSPAAKTFRQMWKEQQNG